MHVATEINFNNVRVFIKLSEYRVPSLNVQLEDDEKKKLSRTLNVGYSYHLLLRKHTKRGR